MDFRLKLYVIECKLCSKHFASLQSVLVHVKQDAKHKKRLKVSFTAFHQGIPVCIHTYVCTFMYSNGRFVVLQLVVLLKNTYVRTYIYTYSMVCTYVYVIHMYCIQYICTYVYAYIYTYVRT